MLGGGGRARQRGTDRSHRHDRIHRPRRSWFVKRDGTKVPLGSFRYPGHVDGEEWLRCPGHTAIDRSELIAVGATDDAGIDILRQELPPAPKIVAT